MAQPFPHNRRLSMTLRHVPGRLSGSQGRDGGASGGSEWIPVDEDASRSPTHQPPERLVAMGARVSPSHSVRCVGGRGRRRARRRRSVAAGVYCRCVSETTSAAHPAAPSDAGISFRSDVTVELVKCAASDRDVVWAARVSTAGEQSLEAAEQDPQRSAGLIRYLMRDRHGSPFEHSHFTFLVSAPIFVFREFMRHRTFSYNEESGRYRRLEPVFYVPGPDRKLVQEGKAGAYTFVDGTDEQHKVVVEATEHACRTAYRAYVEMLEAGVAREVARGVLPVATYSSMYASCNARALMHFLSLRTKREGSAYPSFPQREIEMVAEQLEAVFAERMPLTYAAFNDFGRVSP
jgi:thymidylate synthase (FAD)